MPLGKYKITLGVFQLLGCFKFEKSFGPEEGKRCQDCEFFLEVFRHLMVQTGFLLATMGVWYLVTFENPTDLS